MTAIKLFLPTLAAAVATIGAAPVLAQTCDGGCNGDGEVGVEEIVLGVRIALGDASTADCVAVDDDGNGVVAVNELLTSVRHALEGCGGAASPTSTPTATATLTPTNTPVPTTVDEADLAAAARVATDPVFRLFDLQESVVAAVIVAGRARRTAQGEPSGVSGCQQLDCELSGTQEVCCSETQFTQTFDDCTFADAGGPGSLTGQLAISSGSSSALCSGAIPLDTSFVLVLDAFTHDIRIGEGLFRSFHQLSESYEMAPADCTVSNPNVFGFGVRGSGRRLLNGVLRRFESDGSGNVITDLESAMDTLEIAVGATQEAEECKTTATLNGSIRRVDFRDGAQFATAFTDFRVVEDPQGDGTLLLQLNGTAGTDCLGDVTLSTVDPLRVRRGGFCFTSGRLESRLADSTVASSYGDGGALDLDFDADGTPDQHFAACTDVLVDQCGINVIGLCGACDESSQCQGGLTCFPCSADCAGGPKRCAFSGTFVTCEDGRF